MEVNDDQLVKWLTANMPRLSQLQRRIVTLRYGLDGQTCVSVTDVENELMITCDELRAEESEVLAIIRHDLRHRN